MNFSNELNLNFPFYKRQQRYQSHKLNIHSHIGRQNCHESAKRMSNKESPTTTSPHTGSIASDAHQNQQASSTPQWHSVLTNSPQWQTHVSTDWQNAQAAIPARKRSLPRARQRNSFCSLHCFPAYQNSFHSDLRDSNKILIQFKQIWSTT